MRLTGYFLPNLIFLLLIVLAWVNIDWVQKTFDYLEEQETTTGVVAKQEPVLVMYDGTQEYSSPPNGEAQPNLFYSMGFSLLQAYSNNSIQVDNPYITGYTQGASGKDDFSINGLVMNSNGDDKLRILGSPAYFSFSGEAGKANGEATSILYDTDNMYWLLKSDGAAISKISWIADDGEDLMTQANSIGVSQADQTSQLIGKVRIEYSRASEQLHIVSERASINGNNDEILLDGKVTMMHMIGTKLITANSRKGYYKLDQEFVLSGDARIQNHEDDSSISAEQIFYDTDALTWRVLAKDGANDKYNNRLQDKIEIIIPQ